jgi:hypothetical protein
MKTTPLLLLLVTVVLTSLGVAQPSATPAASDQAWRESHKTDPAQTYSFTRYTLVGKFVSSAPVAERPALMIDCIAASDSHRSKGRFLNASLLVGKTLKIDYVEPEEIHGVSYYPKVGVRYSTDNGGHEQQENWAPGTDRTPAVMPTDKTSASIPKDALKRMLRAHTVAISADDEQGAEVQMQFDIPDPKAVEAGCNVD